MSKMRYSKDVDILTVTLSEKAIDYAEESGPVIVHFSKEGQPVLLEIQGAKTFVLESLHPATANSIDINGRGCVRLPAVCVLPSRGDMMPRVESEGNGARHLRGSVLKVESHPAIGWRDEAEHSVRVDGVVLLRKPNAAKTESGPRAVGRWVYPHVDGARR